jgi:hypothetical protein
MTHFKSNALARTILKIFWTLMDAAVEQKISEACIALAKRFACDYFVSANSTVSMSGYEPAS